MNKSNLNTRVVYFDVLNILSCLAVISLHHNGTVWNFTRTWTWRTALIVECFAYWAVPVFLMLSGATLLNYPERYSTGKFFKKRIAKTLFPWLFWSIVVLIWKIHTGQIILEEHGICYIINLILTNKVENVYWFFITLFGIYLSIPILSALRNNRKMLWYITDVSFITLGCLPAINRFTGLELSITVPAASGLIIFPVLGYLLATMELKPSKRITLYLLGVAGCLFHYIYTYIMSFQTGVTDTSIKGYQMFYSVLPAAAVFVFIKYIPWNRLVSDKFKDILRTMSSYSFGIYLIHMIVIYYELKMVPFDNRSWIWRTGFIFVTYFIAMGICTILGKIPGIRKMIGK